MPKKIFKISKRILDKIFELVISIKAFFGFFEILAGIVFAISGKLAINNFIINLAQQEILEDKYDFITNYLITITNNISAGTYIFAVIYLIFRILDSLYYQYLCF